VTRTSSKRRPDLTLPFGFRFFQRIENERHQLPRVRCLLGRRRDCSSGESGVASAAVERDLRFDAGDAIDL
jgi:hypothetical protein